MIYFKMELMFLKRNVSFKKKKKHAQKLYSEGVLVLYVVSWLKISYSHFSCLLESRGIIMESGVLWKTPNERLESMLFLQ